MPSGRIVDIPTYDGMKLKGTVYSAGENRPCVVMASGVCSRAPTLFTPISVSSCSSLARLSCMEMIEDLPPARYNIDFGLVLWFARPLFAGLRGSLPPSWLRNIDF